MLQRKQRFIFMFMLLAITFPARESLAGRGLTFQERVNAQRSIERNYYSHQLGATAGFEEAVPDAVLEEKVRTYLKQGEALEHFWGTVVSAEMVEAEMRRIAHDSRFPNRLGEIFSGLENDPILIQECFVRPILVERLVRDFFAQDERIHDLQHAAAETLRSRLILGNPDIWANEPHRTVITVSDAAVDEARVPNHTHTASGFIGTKTLAQAKLEPKEFRNWRAGLPKHPGEISEVKNEKEAFVVRAVLNEERERITLAVYTIPKLGFDEWWRANEQNFSAENIRTVAGDSAVVPDLFVNSAGTDPICDAQDRWDNGHLSDQPQPREGHSAIWTGNVMIVWGGFDAVSMNTGARYDPLTNDWKSTSTLNAPAPRTWHSAVWTGREMIVWGGFQNLGSFPFGYLNTGGKYDPVADRWAPVSLVGAPAGREKHTAVWTGTEMLVWGGISDSTYLDDGGRYDSATDTWVPISKVNAPITGTGHTAVWTGTRMIVWGGYHGFYPDTGGTYDPLTNTWVPGPRIPLGRKNHSAIWTGSEMIIWGGSGVFPALNDGWKFSPSLGVAWSISSLGAPSPRLNHSAVWTGTEMLIWGGEPTDCPCCDCTTLGDGARYDPLTDRWNPISPLNAPSPRQRHTAVWTGKHMVVWGGFRGSFSLGGGARYDPSADMWTPAEPAGWPSARSGHHAVWTGNEMILWGGISADLPLRTGDRYEPLTDSWRSMAIDNAPDPRLGHAMIWTGQEVVVWGGVINLASNVGMDTGARYNPILDSWVPTSMAGAPSARSGHGAIWTGRSVVIWGGIQGSQLLNTGGRYDPFRDLWTPTSTVAAPPPLYSPLTVWTGDRMLVWGVSQSGGGFGPASGGRYNPEADTWSSMSLTGSPSPSNLLASVWTGSEMIIWGITVSFPPSNTGGRYNPASDSWRPISLTNAPAGRFGNSAIWTGHEMIIWGGFSFFTSFASDGGRYDPVLDTWRPTSLIGIPSPRTGHTAVWTGEEMIVWGGQGYGTLNTGGRYLPSSSMPVQADAGPDVSVECSSPLGATVQLEGKGNGCGDSGTLTFEWKGPFPEGGGTLLGASQTVTLPLGMSDLTLTVKDGQGQQATDTVRVTVTDTVPPRLTLVMAPSVLWPPNHRMVDVGVSFVATDACSSPSVVLSEVTSSEPDESPGPGDGNTVEDIQNAEPGTADDHFQLRAERDGGETGRVYQVVYAASDSSGNQAHARSLVLVPHDLGGSTEPVLVFAEDGPEGTVLRWDPVPGASSYIAVRGITTSVREVEDFIDLGTVSCVQPNSAVTSTHGHEDLEIPALGEVFFYLVAYSDGRDSGYGTATATKPRLSTGGGCE